MIITKRMYLENAKETDIVAIMEMERHEDNRNFIWQGTYDEHIKEIESDDFLLLVFKQRDTDETVGFALICLDKKSERFELRRIAVAKKGLGYGREALTALIKYAFEDLNMNRFWLDVYPDNFIGIKLYEGIGMHKDGVLRQNYKSDRGYLDMIIYSMLKQEYFEGSLYTSKNS
ncbi:MAG: GNAT family N-acetyltransferase [Sedimentibacter sp.]